MEKSIPYGVKNLKGARRGPKKSLGQHFLKDPAVARGITALVNPEAGDFLIEIGPGRGEITLPLLSDIKNLGLLGEIHYVALEKDEELAATLREKAEKSGFGDTFRVVTGDALQTLPETVGNRGNLKVFGNIPYYLTGKLFRTVFDLEKQPKTTIFMVQAEVAERIVSSPGNTNRLSAFVHFWGIPKIAIKVPKSSFSPKPKVDSAVLLIERRLDTDMPEKNLRDTYATFVKGLFAQPRKTAENNLSALFGGKSEGKKRAQEFLQELHMDKNARPQDFDVETLIRGARLLYNKLDGTQKK